MTKTQLERSILPAATALILACMSAPVGAQSFAVEFQDGAPKWQTVLDGVMGGRSTGRVGVSDQGVLSFTGNLSLENNGGFSQIRTEVDGERLTDAQGIVLECRGDGRSYNFDVRVANARTMAGGFQAPFTTVADQWTEIRLPFEDFRLFSFGRRIANAPELDPQRIESIGVTLSDKQPGDFRLEIRSIKALRAGAESTVRAPAGDDKVLPPEPRSISEVAAADARLSTLLTAARSAGLVRQLERQPGPWTVFAPVDSAFAKLPTGTVQSLLEPDNRSALTQILGLHIVRGRFAASELLGQQRLTTLAGQPLAVSLQGGRITIGKNATMIANDIQVSNGVIHLIDTVLLPAEPAPVAVVTARAAGADAMTRELAEAVAGVYEAAIDRGVPLFNAGNTDACAAVYEIAIEAMLLLGGEDLGQAVVQRLGTGLRQGKAEASSRERAWLLRAALDEIYVGVRRTIDRDPRQGKGIGVR